MNQCWKYEFKYLVFSAIIMLLLSGYCPFYWTTFFRRILFIYSSILLIQQGIDTIVCVGGSLSAVEVRSAMLVHNSPFMSHRTFYWLLWNFCLFYFLSLDSFGCVNVHGRHSERTWTFNMFVFRFKKSGIVWRNTLGNIFWKLIFGIIDQDRWCFKTFKWKVSK